LLHNGDFSDGLARWFFAGRHYFVPWHIDNLFLEMLSTRASSACCSCSSLLALACVNLLRGPGRACFGPLFAGGIDCIHGSRHFFQPVGHAAACFPVLLAAMLCPVPERACAAANPLAAPSAPVRSPDRRRSLSEFLAARATIINKNSDVSRYLARLLKCTFGSCRELDGMFYKVLPPACVFGHGLDVVPLITFVS
jgi:hypothetical protein